MLMAMIVVVDDSNLVVIVMEDAVRLPRLEPQSLIIKIIIDVKNHQLSSTATRGWKKQDKVNTADSASKSMVRLVRAEKKVLCGLIFARKIARMILIQII